MCLWEEISSTSSYSAILIHILWSLLSLSKFLLLLLNLMIFLLSAKFKQIIFLFCDYVIFNSFV